MLLAASFLNDHVSRFAEVFLPFLVRQSLLNHQVDDRQVPVNCHPVDNCPHSGTGIARRMSKAPVSRRFAIGTLVAFRAVRNKRD
jgi:hypothetical protein